MLRLIKKYIGKIKTDVIEKLRTKTFWLDPTVA